MSVAAAPVPKAGDSFLLMADLITFCVTDADSRGRMTVVEIRVPIQGGPPPLHTHPPDEAFHVIEGQLTLFKGFPGATERRVLAPGETDHVPGGTPHTFRNFSDAEVRVLAVFAPGAVMERFIIEAGHRVIHPGSPPRLDLAAEIPHVFEVGSRLGFETLPPPE